jgi:ElaB/YqjD/DUF883 family membrane-anchored ribosome-binding protein
MNTLTKIRAGSVETAAKTLIDDGKNLADAIYEHGVDRVNEVEKNVREYSDRVLTTIQKNPMSSMLISSGIGFLLALLLRK